MYGSVVNQGIANAYRDGDIRIGAGVTELSYSDRTAWYIKGIVKNKKNEIKELELERAWISPLGDGYFECSPVQLPGYFRDTEGTKRIKKTRKGTWTSTGTVNGTLFRIGCADEYYDPSF